MTRLERPGREKGREKMMLWSREEELDRGREDTAQTCIPLISEAQKNECKYFLYWCLPVQW